MRACVALSWLLFLFLVCVCVSIGVLELSGRVVEFFVLLQNFGHAVLFSGRVYSFCVALN